MFKSFVGRAVTIIFGIIAIAYAIEYLDKKIQLAKAIKAEKAARVCYEDQFNKVFPPDPNVDWPWPPQPLHWRNVNVGDCFSCHPDAKLVKEEIEQRFNK